MKTKEDGMLKILFSPDKNQKKSFRLQKSLSPAVWLWLILILGTALRLYDLGIESYWIDEISTLIEAQQSIPQLLTSGRLDQPPAFYIPFHFWIQFFGSNEVSTRLFSALAGIGSIVLIYLIGRELFGKTVGLLSAFMMAISGFQIYYSQIARFYSFFVLIVQLSFLFFILALKKKKNIFFALYVVDSILMLYSHTFGVFILAAQNLFILLQWNKFKHLIITWLICQALVLVVFLPYLYNLVKIMSDIEGAVASNVGKMSVPYLFDPLHSAYRFILPSRRLYGQEIVFASLATAGVFFTVGIIFYIFQQGIGKWLKELRGLVSNLLEEKELKGKLLLVGCWFVCPIILPFIVSFIIIPVYKDYYTIGAAPALYLLLALGMYKLRKVIPIIISLSVLVIMVAPSLRSYYVKDMNEQWIEAAEHVEQNSVPDDVIVFAPNENIGIQQKTFNWYYQGTLQSCGLGVPLPDSEIWNALRQCVSGHERFWVIIRGTNADLPCVRYKSFFLNPYQTALNLIQEHNFVGVSVYLFELAKR